MLCVAILGIALVWISWTALCLFHNISRARKIGVPIIIIPISHMNIVWIVLQNTIISVIERFFGSSNFTRFSSRDWHFREKARPHVQLGPVFALVTPGEIWLNVADLDAVLDIFQRRTHFVRPAELYKMMDVFGPNALSVDQHQWKRHRKLIAAPFNERANALVWSESIRQAQEMIEGWTKPAPHGNPGLQKNARTISLNVLAATALGGINKHGDSAADDYRAALTTLMDNVLFMLLVPHRLLQSRFVPTRLRKIGHAMETFKAYMLALLDRERRLADEGKPGASPLTSALWRASEEQPSQSQADFESHGKGLTVRELLGNIFFINFAGHDTTANALTYAIVHLAINPEVQEWIAEEILDVTKDEPCGHWQYEDVFPQLQRVLAVMYETLRLFPPVMAVPKHTRNEPQALVVSGHCIDVPPNVYVMPSLLAMHTHPEHWGIDALEWRPSRWITSDSKFFEPQKGSYFPWSQGAQNCPGNKFSQVEFVAVLAAVFRYHRVQPLCNERENEESARKCLAGAVQEISHGVLLSMKDADGFRYLWRKVD